MANAWVIVLVRIDEFGNHQQAGTGSLAEGESVEDVMTLEDAKREHMQPAVAEAETTQKRWRESRPKPEERPAPEPPMDPATRRFVADGNEIEYEAWAHARRRL
jgi:hypothetical protein